MNIRTNTQNSTRNIATPAVRTNVSQYAFSKDVQDLETSSGFAEEAEKWAKIAEAAAESASNSEDSIRNMIDNMEDIGDDVLRWRNETEQFRNESEQFNKDTASNAALAKESADYAVASSQNSIEASLQAKDAATNAKLSEDKAKEYADKSQEIYEAFVKGAVYRGGWNPMVTPQYPDASGVNSYWDVWLNEGTETYDWNDITWSSGDRLIYSVPDSKYFHINRTVGVSSVNGKTGAVVLTAEDVGTYDKEEIDSLIGGRESGWRLACRSEPELRTLIETNRNNFAASGFVNYGKGYTNNTNNFIINEGLWTTEAIADQANKLRMGRSLADTGFTGPSKTKFAVTAIAGFVSKLLWCNEGEGRTSIHLPPAPDGTITYNKTSGEIRKYSTPAEAFAEENDSVEVVVNRTDLFGAEYFLEEVSSTNPFVYPYGMIQSAAPDMEGIPTETSNRPESYYRVYGEEPKVAAWAVITVGESRGYYGYVNDHSLKVGSLVSGGSWNGTPITHLYESSSKSRFGFYNVFDYGILNGDWYKVKVTLVDEAGETGEFVFEEIAYTYVLKFGEGTLLNWFKTRIGQNVEVYIEKYTEAVMLDASITVGSNRGYHVGYSKDIIGSLDKGGEWHGTLMEELFEDKFGQSKLGFFFPGESGNLGGQTHLVVTVRRDDDSSKEFVFIGNKGSYSIDESRTEKGSLHAWLLPCIDKQIEISVRSLSSKQTKECKYPLLNTKEVVNKGKCVNFWNASDEEKTKLVSNPDHNLFLLNDDRLVQWRMRQRTIAGAGNGDWGNVNPVAGDPLNFTNIMRGKPQGIQNTVESLGVGSPNDYLGSKHPIAERNMTGVFEVNAATSRDYGVNGECYFHVWGMVPRLNKGAYHPSFNPMGACPVRNQGNNAYVKWYEDSTLLTDVKKCFSFGAEAGKVNPDYSGKIGTASGRDDGKFYDAIYASGQGGVIDYRLSAWDMSSKEEASKVFQKVVNGTYRGKEQLSSVKSFVANATTSAQSGGRSIKVPYASVKGDTSWITSTAYNDVQKCYGHVIVGGVTLTIDGISDNKGGSEYWLNCYPDGKGTSIGETVNACIGPYTEYSVSGDFEMQDVMGSPTEILKTPQLANGWLGGWIPVIPTGAALDFPATRKALNTPSQTYRSSSSSSWVYDSVLPNGWNSTTNTRKGISYPSTAIAIWQYTAFAKQTKESVKNVVLNGSEGVGDVSVLARQDYSLLQESLLGKVGTSSGSHDLETLTLNQFTIESRNSGGGVSQGKFIGGNYAPRHAPVSIAVTNNSPACKFLWHQSSDNQQCSLSFAWSELVWGGITTASRTGTTGESYTQGTVYYITGGRHAGKILKCNINATITLDSYYTGSDGVLWQSSGNPVSQVVTYNGTQDGWGDDSTIKIVDGTSTYTNLNGDTCLYGTAELSIPYGFTKNKARVGSQMPGVDL